MKKITKKLLCIITILSGSYIGLKSVAFHCNEDKQIDTDNLYVNTKTDIYPNERCSITLGLYEGKIKPMIDQIFSFIGLIVLSPLFVLISLVVYLDDPGPIFFLQKRVGKNGKFFMLHKFRSMKMSTPHDIPTHQLVNPQQYITKAGAFLRRTSLDELPQIWDIFRGKMSIIGPRPALWNQVDLIEERSKYNANSVMPGLTGLAQITGRDELLITDKAKIDGKYVEGLRRSDLYAFMQDVKCFINTITSVLHHEGVVEGGTGTLSEPQDGLRTEENENVITDDEIDAGFRDYGYKKKFIIDYATPKKVLITGDGSYIGQSFIKWVHEHYPGIDVSTVDMIDGSWRQFDFSPYDTVFHVAGIAHVDIGNASEETQKKYYEINTDLAIETAKVAKTAGVKQFIFMSSMIIYGDSAPYGQEKVIDERTIPIPVNFYGDSKWQADKGVRKLQEEAFKVAVLRPPMIYGRGCKGNYRVLSRLAKRLPVFPDANNARSMLYIDNLCEFVSLLVLSGEGGVYFPQNKEYTKTSNMVQTIAYEAGHTIKISRLFNPFIKLACHIPKASDIANKAFGNSVYSQKLSNYEGLEYHVYTLPESIALTEL